ncbi:hypothetical protein H6P81_008238 [Aristolochia fimbriata]|uniref:Tetratricopeptide repeat protein 27 homolog n=1 Tax=Aristolochia fimbriata TaxID=158543 RepID=A0AAV7F3V0_ARIFI|nr:hypothetical protein H6P81_008238 [Aristolochia fimbriata]
MDGEELELLKSFELRLLRCTLSPPETSLPFPPSKSLLEQKPIYQSIHHIVSLIEEGNYVGALSSDSVRQVLPFVDAWEFQDSDDAAARFYSEVDRSVTLFLQDESEAWLSVLGDEDGLEKSRRTLLVMCLGIAALLAFVQFNVTGPVEKFPDLPISVGGFRKNDVKEWDMWARRKLMLSASDLLGRFSLVQYIVFAEMLLIKTKDIGYVESDSYFSGPATILWWLCRLLFLQQNILDERSSSLFDLIQVFMRQSFHHFGDLDKVVSYWGTQLREKEALAVVSLANLEAGIIELSYGRVESSSQFFKRSEEACGLHLSVTGVLGFRRVYQVDPKAQLVLVAEQDEDSSYKAAASGNSNCTKDEVASEIKEITDILMTPRLIEDGKDGTSAAAKVVLDAVQQAVVLSQCLIYRRSGRDEEYQRYQMAPFIEAIDSQQSSCYMIKCFGNFLRIQNECQRSKTKERALMMMDKLVQGLYEVSPGAAQRIQFCFGVNVPAIPALRKEYGEQLVRCGMVGEALKIFEDLELWDNLILCYSLLGKKPAAVDLIKSRLSERPNDPKLWCSLGDVTDTDAYYYKALEVSNDRSARAKRSLARSAYNRGDYEKSKLLWESAMALNSLFPDGWFALGAAALKARDVDKALEAFRRAVQLDPDNGEAWNNIACLQKVLKKNKEAFIAFKEALKFRRNSWQMWENYSQVAMDIGNFSQALEAIKMVLDLSNNKRIDTELLDKLLEEVESRTSTSMLSIKDSECAQESLAWTRETEAFMDSLGKILQQVVRSGGGGDVWGLYARWLKIKGDLTMCSEALLKHVRSYQGSDLWHDQDRFKKFSRASLQLCKVYMEIASSTASRRELHQAEMHLKNTIKQAYRFEDTEDYRDLQACYEEVQKRIEEFSTESALIGELCLG